MNTIIYMVRHAKSPFLLGQEKTRGLSEDGFTDTTKVTAIMQSEPVDLIVSSPYTRAIQTIEQIAHIKNKEIKRYEGLKERKLKGEFRLTESEILQAIQMSFDDIDFRLQDGESIRDVQNRAIPIIKMLLHEYSGKNIVIGTHGNVMTIILNYFNPSYGYEFWKNTSKPDIYKLEFSNEKLCSVERLWAQ